MILSDEVKVALERWHWNTNVEDTGFLADEMLRLFPPGYFDEITPENLVKAGFDDKQFYKILILIAGNYELQWWEIEKELHIRVAGTTEFPAILKDRFAPRNMGEVLELIARCKEPKQ